MMKLRMRISGSFRSEQGARDFATLRSVLSTAKQQRLNRIQVPMQGPEALQASVKHSPGRTAPAVRSRDPPTSRRSDKPHTPENRCLSRGQGNLGGHLISSHCSDNPI